MNLQDRERFVIKLSSAAWSLRKYFKSMTPSYVRVKVEVDLVGEFPMHINIISKNKTER